MAAACAGPWWWAWRWGRRALLVRRGGPACLAVLGGGWMFVLFALLLCGARPGFLLRDRSGPVQVVSEPAHTPRRKAASAFLVRGK